MEKEQNQNGRDCVTITQTCQVWLSFIFGCFCLEIRPLTNRKKKNKRENRKKPKKQGSKKKNKSQRK